MERIWEMARNLGEKHQQVVPLTVFVAVLCFCLIIGHFFEENRWINESITALLIASIMAQCCYDAYLTRAEAMHILQKEGDATERAAEAGCYNVYDLKKPDFDVERERERWRYTTMGQPECRTLMCYIVRERSWRSYIEYVSSKGYLILYKGHYPTKIQDLKDLVEEQRKTVHIVTKKKEDELENMLIIRRVGSKKVTEWQDYYKVIVDKIMPETEKWKEEQEKMIRSLLVHTCVECCFYTYCGKDETIHILHTEVGIDESYTEKVWDKLEEANPDFTSIREKARKETPFGLEPRSIMFKDKSLEWRSYVEYIMNDLGPRSSYSELQQAMEAQKENGEVYIATRTATGMVRLQAFGKEELIKMEIQHKMVDKIMHANVSGAGPSGTNKRKRND